MDQIESPHGYESKFYKIVTRPSVSNYKQIWFNENSLETLVQNLKKSHKNWIFIPS